MPVAINPPNLNIDAPNSFMTSIQGSGWIWSALKIGAIIFAVLLIVGLLVLAIVLVIRALLL